MFTLQQVEQAEERVQAWHGEMRRCMSEQQERDEENGQRRSWRATLVHCLRFVSGRRAAQPARTSTTLSPKTWGR